MYMFVTNMCMKFLCVNLWLGELYTDNDDDNDINIRRTKHDDIGSFGIIPNEPKTTKQHSHSNVDRCSLNL